MKKQCVLLYSMCLLAINLYGFSGHTYYVGLLLSPARPYMILRTTLVVVLMVYAFVPWLRLYVTKALLGLGGVALMCLGLTSIASPTLLGHLTTWMLPGDDIAIIEGGILAIVLSAELSTHKIELPARTFTYVRSFFTTKPAKLTYYPPLRSAKILKTVS